MMAKRRSRGRSRRGSYKYTARRRVALKKAQQASARKRLAAPNKVQATRNSSGRKFNTAAMGGRRRKTSLRRNIALTSVGVGAVTAAGVVARHKLSGSSFQRRDIPIVSVMGNVTGSRRPSLSTNAFTKQTNTSQTHKYVRVNVRTGEKTDVTRTVKGGTKVLGRDFTYTTGKQGPLGSSSAFTYQHRKLQVSDVLGSKIQNRLMARRARFPSTVSGYEPDRGQNRREDPNNPGFNKKGEKLPTLANWGSYGKRLAPVGRKFYGTTELFSNIGASGKVKGFTTIGGALTGKKGH